jgi:predicted RNase H-like HicB family nuclease
MGVEVNMLFPIVIHKDADSCYSVSIPDMPGCFTAGDSLQEAVGYVQQAAECHYFEEPDLPTPSDLEQWINDPDFVDGIWVMVDIDLSRLQVKAKRVNITLPENLLSHIDRYVSAHHLTRSGLLAQAASRYMSEHP